MDTNIALTQYIFAIKCQHNLTEEVWLNIIHINLNIIQTTDTWSTEEWSSKQG